MRQERPVPSWFQRDLALINENYFCVWNPSRREFQVRFWLHRFYRPRTLEECFRESKIVHVMPYKDFDERNLYSLRLGLYNAKIAEQILREVDEYNKQVDVKNDAEETYQHRAAAKDIWRHYHSPRVFIHRNP